MKVLVEKMFMFVELVWLTYIEDNNANIRHVLFTLYCTYVVYMCLSIQYIFFREIKDKERDREVEDGAVQPEEESDDDDDD